MNLRPLTLMGIVVSMVTGVALGISGYRAWLQQDTESQAARMFDRMLDQVQASYVHPVDKRELVQGAFQGMLGKLDDYSRFLDRGDYHELQADTAGRFGGVGIELGLTGRHFTVVSTTDGQPAARAGIRAGDHLVEIDHHPVQGRRLLDVVDDLRGRAGSAVRLRVERHGKNHDMTLTRAVIEVPSVEGRLLEPGYAYVRITEFQSGTGDAFRSKIRDLRRQSGNDLHGLILDLRNNPGGVLQASVAVADALLDGGLIVYTQGRLPSSKQSYQATRGDLLDGAPVVVLMNGGSASASEIVAGALQDRGRAVLMGTRSYGKGSVQSVMPLSGDEAIKLTTAYYFTPNGRSIHHKGIEPDLLRARGDETSAQYDTRLLGDAVAALKQRVLEQRGRAAAAAPLRASL